MDASKCTCSKAGRFGRNPRRGSGGFDEEDVEGAGAVDALNASHLDVGRGRGAGDEGGGEVGGGGEESEGLGDGLDDLRGA